MSKKHKKTEQAPGGFIRTSITIPAEISGFAFEQAGQPEHAGNLSSYVRTLIIRDRQERQPQQKKAA